jgi:hypothetical protein
MPVFGRRRLFFLCASFVILLHLEPANGTPSSVKNINQSHNKTLEVIKLIALHLFWDILIAPHDF